MKLDVISVILFVILLFFRAEAATSRTSAYFIHSELLDRQRDVFSDKEVAFQCK